MIPFPRYIFCGDDFTGASDTLATLARSGLRCRLFLAPEAIQNCPDLAQLDAAGIATATRSMGPEAIIDTLHNLQPILTGRDDCILHYKVCSTFDSSPETGSIGAAIGVLKNLRKNTGVLVAGGQPSLGRYCIFSNLFAKAADGAVYRIDRHPTMAHHPVTPMEEADLRKLLHSQGIERIEGIHRLAYDTSSPSLEEQVLSIWQQDGIALLDVEDATDIDRLGQLFRLGTKRPLLCIGSSSIAEAYLSSEQGSSGESDPRSVSVPNKPVFILAGSRSPVTAKQVEQAKGFHKLHLHPRDIETGTKELLAQLLTKVLQAINQGTNVLVAVSDNMDHNLSKAEIAGFTAELSHRIASSGAVDRICIAGGDTSSLAMQQLGVDSISFLADIEPGLCLCRLHADGNSTIDGLEVVLKGGQMGSDELFNTIADPL